MTFFLEKLKYIIMTGLAVVLTQVPFLVILSMDNKQSLLNTLIVIAVYGLIIFLFLYVAKKENLLTFDFSFFNGSSVKLLVLSYFVSFAIGILAAIVMQLEGAPLIPQNQERVTEITQQIPKIISVISIVIGAPIMEEIIFRGLIPKKLFAQHQVVGYVVGAILFGFFHSPTNIGSFILYGGMGAVFAYVAYKTDRLEMSILAHMLRNGIAVVLMLFLM